MPDLTDADKKSFIGKVAAAIEGSKAVLTTAGWDPTQRVTTLKAGENTVDNDEKIISPLEVALAQANATRRADLDATYKLASATVSAVEGVLGKDHALVIDLHQLRGGMSQAPTAPTLPKP